MRIAIVNDIPIAVEILKRVVMSDFENIISWVAMDGRQAVEKCAVDIPEVILMDLIMPVMNGVEATDKIMTDSPCPILVVTATVDGNQSKVFEAMGKGALDVVETPVFKSNGRIFGGDKLLFKINNIKKLSRKIDTEIFKNKNVRKERKDAHHKLPNLILIGASTGGPKALLEILTGLEHNIDAAIIIVQHINSKFAKGLIEWLNSQSPLDVIKIENGMQVENRKVYVAATDNHMVIGTDLKLAYTDSFSNISYRPSVDVFFKSIAVNWPHKSIAILLTGMGNDGAQGLKFLSECGWHTIAQDENSCIVFGMPKSAINLGAAKEVLDINFIAKRINSYLKENK